MFLKSSKGFPENFGYLNARLRARFGDFLAREDYRRLASRSLEDIEVFLLDTRYGKSFRRSLIEQSLSTHRKIEMALADTSASVLSHTRNMAMGEPEDLISVILSRADLQNGRLLVRYFFIGIPYEMQPRWHAYGTLPVRFFAQLWKSPSVAHGIDKCLAFDHPLARALARALEQVVKGSSLPASERALLSGMLVCQERVLDSHRTKNSALVKEYLARTIDVWNLNIWSRVFSGVMQKEKAAELYLKGGFSLSPERLQGSPEPAGLLDSTPWENILDRSKGGPAEIAPGGAMREFWRWQISLRRKDPLGIEVAISFIAHQLVEWRNLDSLVVGVSMGFEGDAILEKLILAG